MPHRAGRRSRPPSEDLGVSIRVEQGCRELQMPAVWLFSFSSEREEGTNLFIFIVVSVGTKRILLCFLWSNFDRH